MVDQLAVPLLAFAQRLKHPLRAELELAPLELILGEMGQVDQQRHLGASQYAPLGADKAEVPTASPSTERSGTPP